MFFPLSCFEMRRATVSLGTPPPQVTCRFVVVGGALVSFLYYCGDLIAHLLLVVPPSVVVSRLSPRTFVLGGQIDAR